MLFSKKVCLLKKLSEETSSNIGCHISSFQEAYSQNDNIIKDVIKIKWGKLNFDFKSLPKHFADILTINNELEINAIVNVRAKVLYPNL